MHLNLEYKGNKFDPQKSKFKVSSAKFYPYDPHTKVLSCKNLKELFIFSLLQLFFGLKFSYKFDLKSKI